MSGSAGERTNGGPREHGDGVAAWRTSDGDRDEAVRFLFLFVGAEPATEWLDACGIALDRGFVLTGTVPADALTAELWRTRRPAPLETSMPGVCAIGDVRAARVKRVGAAIGEGAAVVAQPHAHLAADHVPAAT